MLTLTDHRARRPEPQRLRLPLFTVPATLARTGRLVLLHLADTAHRAWLAGQGIARLRTLAASAASPASVGGAPRSRGLGILRGRRRSTVAGLPPYVVRETERGAR